MWVLYILLWMFCFQLPNVHYAHEFQWGYPHDIMYNTIGQIQNLTRVGNYLSYFWFSFKYIICIILQALRLVLFSMFRLPFILLTDDEKCFHLIAKLDPLSCYLFKSFRKTLHVWFKVISTSNGVKLSQRFMFSEWVCLWHNEWKIVSDI